MTMQEALFALGVREDSLTPEEKERLDRDGYLLLPNILTQAEAERIAARLDALVAEEGERAGIETHKETGSDRLSDLVNKDALFTPVYTHPRVLAAVAHIMGGEFRLSSLNSRAPQPGLGTQYLHRDYEDPAPLGEFHGCNTIWALDDFTEENGPTRVVPDSHLLPHGPAGEMDNLNAPHPREVKLLAPVGSVLVVNAHTWHSGTQNRNLRPRRAMHGYFCRRDEPQQTDQRAYIRPETYARLSEAARYILDV